jgi:SagB-type dehydrogenase family enzyme
MMKPTAFMLALLLSPQPLVGEEGAMKLPAPRFESTVSIETALRNRRSIREYRNAPITLADLSQLLWATQGVTNAAGFRTAPSAGALYPLEVSVLVANVEGLSPGIYRYHPHGHTLSRTQEGDYRRVLTNAALGQSSIHDAAATLVITAVSQRTTAKYGQRGVRYVQMEAGHAAQNLYLQAEALQLGTVAIGAFDDEAVKQGLHLPVEEEPLYLLPVGKR